MAKPYLLRPLAEADLEEIWLYTAKLWSMEQADSYIRSFADAFGGLAKGLKQGRPSVLPDYQKYLCGSHAIYFVMNDDYVDVVRILHQSQDVERHL